MLTEILVSVLVVVVACLVVMDVARTKIDVSHGHTDGLAHDARPRITADTHGGRTSTFLREPVGTGIPAAVSGAGPAPGEHEPARRWLPTLTRRRVSCG